MVQTPAELCCCRTVLQLAKDDDCRTVLQEFEPKSVECAAAERFCSWPRMMTAELELHCSTRTTLSWFKLRQNCAERFCMSFNPNLYNEGKVCLSLLGTWEGAQGEQWNAETSTIIQVLISIQSLILCPEPYYNEPGFERNYGTSVGNAESNRYNEEVFKNNLKFAILGQLGSPPEGFEEVTRAHFYLKRHSLIKELETQQELYKGKDVKKLVGEVKAELLKLQKPDFVKVPN